MPRQGNDSKKKKVAFAPATPGSRRSAHVAGTPMATPKPRNTGKQPAATPIQRTKNAKDAPSPLSAAKPSGDDMEVDDAEDSDAGSALAPVNEENEESSSDSSLSEDEHQDLSERLRGDTSFVPDDTADNIITEPDAEGVPSSRNSTVSDEESHMSSPPMDARAGKRPRSPSPDPSKKASRTETHSAPGGVDNTLDLTVTDDTKTKPTKPKPSDDPAPKATKPGHGETAPKSSDNPAPKATKPKPTDDASHKATKSSDDPAPKPSKPKASDDAGPKPAKAGHDETAAKPSKPKPSEDPAPVPTKRKSKASDDTGPKTAKAGHDEAAAKPSKLKPSEDHAPNPTKRKSKPSDDANTNPTKPRHDETAQKPTKSRPSDDLVPKSSKPKPASNETAHKTTKPKPRHDDAAPKHPKCKDKHDPPSPRPKPKRADEHSKPSGHKHSKAKVKAPYVEISDDEDSSNSDEDSSSSDDTESELIRLRLEKKERRKREKQEKKRKQKKEKKRSKKRSLSPISDSDDDKKKSKVSKGDKPGSLKYFKAQGQDVGHFATLIKRVFFRMLCKNGWWPGIFDKATRVESTYNEALKLWRELKQADPEDIPPIPSDDVGLYTMCKNFPPEMRGKIKTIAVGVVLSSYKLLEPPEDVEVAEHIASEVARLDNDYLFAKRDANAPIGTHDAVFEVVQKGFFCPENLVHRYELEAVTPLRINVISLAILALQCALSEWSSGAQATKQFSDGTYRPRHATVMGLLTTFHSGNTTEWTAMMARHDANRDLATPPAHSSDWKDAFDDEE